MANKKRVNKALRLLLITNGVIIFASATLGPILALFVEDLGGDLLSASWAAAFYAIAAGVTVLVVGLYTDRVKQMERFVAVGYVIMAIGFVGYALIESPAQLFAVQAFIGLGEALAIPAFDALYTKHVDEGREAFQWSLWEASDLIISGLAAIAGGYIVTWFGFNPLFYFMGGVTVLSGFYMLRLGDILD